MRKTEKPNLLRIIVEAAIPVLLGLLFPIILEIITMESVIVAVSASADLDGQFLTTVSVQNLEDKTLSRLSLYIDEEIEIVEIKANNSFYLHKHYITSDSISPKENCTIIIWTKQPILKGQIVSEGDYKIRLTYSDSSTPFIVQVFWVYVIAGIVMVAGSSIILWLTKKQHLAIHNRIQEVNKKSELCSLESEKLKEIISVQKKENQREINEIRLYYITRISDLKKELTFWRDTVRKMLYNSQDGFLTADKVVETVTSALKTYTTREGNTENNMDEMLYLAQLIADSRELHRRDSSNDMIDYN